MYTVLILLRTYSLATSLKKTIYFIAMAKFYISLQRCSEMFGE